MRVIGVKKALFDKKCLFFEDRKKINRIFANDTT